MSNEFFNKLNSKNIDLNDAQKQAVNHKDGPCLVLAVPGAGKTTVLISRVASLIYQYGLNPNSILSITFSKFAALNMRERYLNLFSDNIYNCPKFSTIHSFSYMLIREYSKQKNKVYKLIENSNNMGKNKLIKKIYRDINGHLPSDDRLEELLSNISYIKNLLISPNSFKNSNINNFSQIFDQYEEYKKKNDLIDFDDMLSLSLDILNKNPQALKFFQNKYKYIQVDEGQDTSLVQYKIIEKLSLPNNNLFIVADDDQSIYGFRGANPEFLLDFESKYDNSTIYFMDLNYRSTPDIVNLSDKFIQQNTIRYKKSLKAFRDLDSKIELYKFKDINEQYDFLTDKLSDLEYNNTAILFRNNISSISIIDLLDRFDIPYRVKDTKLNFFNNPILKDIICFFELSIDPSNFNAFQQIYYKMKGYISKKGIGFVSKNIDISSSVFKTLEDFDELQPFQSKNIRNLGFDFSRLSKLSPENAMDFIENNLEYLEYVDKRADYLGYGKDSSLTQLSYIHSIVKRCSSILDFLERINFLKSSILEQNEDDGVFISTIHSAKGLEFDNVFMVDLINGDFPSSSSIKNMDTEDFKEIEEERRLFYVGMTRAKNNLYLSSFLNRSDQNINPSMFLTELEGFLSSDKDSLLSVNTKIRHKNFGIGTIIDCDSISLLVDFKDSKRKQLLKKPCLENNLIEILAN